MVIKHNQALSTRIVLDSTPPTKKKKKKKRSIPVWGQVRDLLYWLEVDELAFPAAGII